MGASGPAAGVVDRLRSTFNEYCKVQVGKARLLYDPSAPKMSQAQYLLLCQDAGVLEPEGGNLTASSINTIFTSYKPVNQHSMPFQYFVRSLSALSTAARTNVHQLIADLAGHIPQYPSIAHVGKMRPFSARHINGLPGVASPLSQHSSPGADGSESRVPHRGDMDVAASADAMWPSSRAEHGYAPSPALGSPDAERQRVSPAAGGPAGVAGSYSPGSAGAGRLDARQVAGAPPHWAPQAGFGPGTGQAWGVPGAFPAGSRPVSGVPGVGGAVGSAAGFPLAARTSGNWGEDLPMSASEAGFYRGSDIPAWGKDDGMPVWLRSLMSRLDALDEHFSNNPPSPSRAAPLPSPTGRPPLAPDAARSSRPPTAGSGGAGQAYGGVTSNSADSAPGFAPGGSSEVTQQLSEIRQLLTTLGHQVGVLTTRVQRVEDRLASKPQSSDTSVAPAASGSGGGVTNEQLEELRRAMEQMMEDKIAQDAARRRPQAIGEGLEQEVSSVMRFEETEM